MIDPTNESLLTLAETGGLVRKHVATVYRWTTTGFRGVILETIQVGGTRCTSHEAFQRFCERVTVPGPVCPPKPANPNAASQKAAQELERIGV